MLAMPLSSLCRIPLGMLGAVRAPHSALRAAEVRIPTSAELARVRYIERNASSSMAIAAALGAAPGAARA